MEPQLADIRALEPQRFQQIAVQFHCVQLADGGQQRPGQRAQARADFHQMIARHRSDRRDDAFKYAGITQEMLAEALAGAMRQGDAHCAGGAELSAEAAAGCRRIST